MAALPICETKWLLLGEQSAVVAHTPDGPGPWGTRLPESDIEHDCYWPVAATITVTSGLACPLESNGVSQMDCHRELCEPTRSQTSHYLGDSVSLPSEACARDEKWVVRRALWVEHRVLWVADIRLVTGQPVSSQHRPHHPRGAEHGDRS